MCRRGYVLCRRPSGRGVRLSLVTAAHLRGLDHLNELPDRPGLHSTAAVVLADLLTLHGQACIHRLYNCGAPSAAVGLVDRCNALPRSRANMSPSPPEPVR